MDITMDFEIKTKANYDYYTPNLIKFSILSVDTIGIILLFILWEPKIGELVIARDLQNKADDMTWYEGIIIYKTDFSHIIHYIGWPHRYYRYTTAIKPYVYQKEWKNRTLGVHCTLSIINKTIKRTHPGEVHLFIQHDKKITRKIITKFPMTIPVLLHLCSHICSPIPYPYYKDELGLKVMYIFATTAGQ